MMVLVIQAMSIMRLEDLLPVTQEEVQIHYLIVLLYLYSRPATGVTPNDEVLVRVDDGTFQFREPEPGARFASTGVDTPVDTDLTQITFLMIVQLDCLMVLHIEI